MPCRGDLTSECKARGRVSGLRNGVDELLHSDEVFLFATAQVFQVDAGKGVGIFLTPKALVEC